MAAHVAAGRQRHGDRTQQHGNEARERQKAAGASTRIADLRAGIGDVVQAPLVQVIQETPPTADLTDEELAAAGCSFAMHAGVARYAVVKALQTVLSALQRDGKTRGVRDMMASFDEYNGVLGLNDWLALEERYLGATAR